MPLRLLADTSWGAVRSAQASSTIDRTHDHMLSKSKGLGKRQMSSGHPNAIALGVHPGGAVEGGEPGGTGHAPGGQHLDHPTGGQVRLTGAPGWYRGGWSRNALICNPCHQIPCRNTSTTRPGCAGGAPSSSSTSSGLNGYTPSSRFSGIDQKLPVLGVSPSPAG